MNNNIKKIVNVYQHKYKNVATFIGFGDYLRGCLFLINFCRNNNIECEIDFTDFVFSKYFENNNNVFISKEVRENISYFEKQNTCRNSFMYNEYFIFDNFLDEFITFCNNTKLYDNNVIYILTNARPISNILDEDRKALQNLLQPNRIIMNEVEDVLFNLNVTKYNYKVIHIRYGDNREHDTNYECIFFKLNQLIQKEDTNIIICDTNNLNLYLFEYYKNNNYIKVINNQKIHSAIIDLNENLSKNILIDFFVMSFSTNITCFSIYEHGSSFSKTCSEIYNINYNCIPIN